MFKQLDQAVDFYKSALPIDNMSEVAIANLLKSGLSFDPDFVKSFFENTGFEFIEDYEDVIEKGRRATVAVGTVRGNFIKTADGWKYHKKEERVKAGHEEAKVVPQHKELKWKKLEGGERQKRIDAAHKRLAEAEKDDKPESKLEAHALRVWLERHKHQDVEKGGQGSGMKGHHTDRKPYPGEEAHKMGPMETRPPKGMIGPNDLTPPHYSDPPMLKQYRMLIKKLGPVAVEGRFHYDPKADKIVATDEGKQLAVAAASMQHK